MYLSIVYDKGWSAYIDGNEVEISSIKDALLAVPVPAGTHTIELKYRTDGLLEGGALTALAVVILVVIIIFEERLKGLAAKAYGNVRKQFSIRKSAAKISHGTDDSSSDGMEDSSSDNTDGSGFNNSARQLDNGEQAVLDREKSDLVSEAEDNI